MQISSACAIFSCMASPESAENDALGQELLIGLNMLAADTFLRSGIPVDADIDFSLISLCRLHTPDEEICLDFEATDGSYKITLSENPRDIDTDSDTPVFVLGPFTCVSMTTAGRELAFTYDDREHDMTLADAAAHIARRLPDFRGSGGSIQIEIPEEE